MNILSKIVFTSNTIYLFPVDASIESSSLDSPSELTSFAAEDPRAELLLYGSDESSIRALKYKKRKKREKCDKKCKLNKRYIDKLKITFVTEYPCQPFDPEQLE